MCVVVSTLVCMLINACTNVCVVLQLCVLVCMFISTHGLFVSYHLGHIKMKIIIISTGLF